MADEKDRRDDFRFVPDDGPDDGRAIAVIIVITLLVICSGILYFWAK